DLGVVAAWDGHHVAGANLELRAIIHVDLHSPRDDVAEVRHLARVGPGDRLDVLGPLPAGLERRLADDLAADVEDRRLPLPLKWPGLVWRVEVPDLSCWHIRLLREGSLVAPDPIRIS